MDCIELHTNYRFQHNKDLLQLDKNIRECAKIIAYPSPQADAVVHTIPFETIEEENEWTVTSIQQYLSISTDDRLAILIKQRSKDINMLVDKLNENRVDFFYALFSDEENDYVNFHNKTLGIFLKLLRDDNPKSISVQFLNKFYSLVGTEYSSANQTEKSLLKLLRAFLNNINGEYKFLERDEKISYIADILSNRSLKQSMEYIDSRVILSTVHGAKGLEWDRVIVRGLKDNSFPSFTLCGKCNQHRINLGECCLDTRSLSKDKVASKNYLEELSVFYVAATRARKSLCVTTNGERINSYGEYKSCQLSCFMRLPGILADIR